MKYPLEFIKCGKGEFDPTKEYDVFRLNQSGVTAYVKDRHRNNIPCRHTGKKLQNGQVTDMTWACAYDEEFALSEQHLAEFHRMHDLQGNPIGDLIEADINNRREAAKATTLKLGNQTFSPMVVLEATLEIRSKNKKPVEDPAATLEIKVKARVWNENYNNWVLTYNPAENTLMWDKKPFHPDNEAAVLSFIKDKLTGIAG